MQLLNKRILDLSILVLCLACMFLYTGCAKQADSTNKQPNIVIILVDDMGYSDLGAYGSEIATPTIDRLAANGVKFSNFHAAAACTPTRGMLLTGVDNHLVGMGNMLEIMADNQFDQPGYE